MRSFFYKKKSYESVGSLSTLAWKRFRKDKLAMCSLVFIVAATLLAILGYLVSPDSTPFANDQHVEMAAKKMGFAVTILKVRKNEAKDNTGFFGKMIFGKKSDYTEIPVFAWHFDGDYSIAEEYTGDTPNDGAIRKFNLADVVYPLKDVKTVIEKNDKLAFEDISGKKYDVTLAALKEKIQQENISKKTYLLGTDRYGRDMLSQLIIGTRVSLSVGFISVIISLVIGILLGALAGFFRGWIDNLIVWFINVVWSIPTLLLVIAITFALGKRFLAGVHSNRTYDVG